MENEKRIIEVNGIKMEVDLRHATRVDQFKVGDNIKVLVKQYQDYASFIGTIIGFDNYETTPTIVIAYLETGYNEAKIKYLYYNANSKEAEITALNDWDIPVTKNTVLQRYDNEIETHKRKMEDLVKDKELFSQLFGKYFDETKPSTL